MVIVYAKTRKGAIEKIRKWERAPPRTKHKIVNLKKIKKGLNKGYYEAILK